MIDSIVFSDPKEIPNEKPDEVIEYGTFDELLKQAFIEADIEYFDKILAEAPESELPPIEYDVTGTPLCPGHPKICLGSGDFPGFECCCDECDHYLACFPEWAPEESTWKEDNKNA